MKGTKMELNAETVKRALECCCGDIVECQKCAYVKNGYIRCKERASQDALALITSQEKMIKKLTEENDKLHASCTEFERKCASLNDENERLSQSLANTKSILANSKADTVKQMQERLLKEFPHHNGKVFGAIGADTVDWVSKEMLEGE
jgi:predicted RNase H-like nuclease (RuvC/YqgF family)